MKINYRRIIKVLSSCVAIAMVLIATVAMPVFAFSNKVIALSDLYTGRVTEGDEVIITYSLNKDGRTPYIYEYTNGVLGSSLHGNKLFFGFWDTDQDTDYVVDFRTYVLGVETSEENTNNYWPHFLDISDLKSHSTLNLSMDLYGDSGFVSARDGLHFKALWAITWVASDGSKVSTIFSDPVTYEVSKTYGQFTFVVQGNFEIPADAVYMIPQLQVVVTAKGGLDSTAQSGQAYMEFKSGTMRASYNSVIENSDTMKAIEDKLGDIDDTLGSIDQSLQSNNDKLDEIINGNDEMSGLAQDKHEEQQELDDKAQDAMDDFDDRTDLDNVLPDEAMQPEDLAGYADWSDDEGWLSWKKIMQPLFSSNLIIQIMMALVAFINISVLLMGR